MKKIVASLIAGAMMTMPIAAKSQTLMWNDATYTHFDWPSIKETAKHPLPGLPNNPTRNMLSPEYKMMEREYQVIVLCRQMLAARQAGWNDAIPGQENPYPPEPMMRPDDMKIPFVSQKP